MVSIFPPPDGPILPPGLQEIAARLDAKDRIWTLLKNTMLIVGFGTACFTGGYNAREIATMREAFDVHVSANDREHATFAKREVVDEQLKALTETIRAMQKQLDRIEEQGRRR